MKSRILIIIACVLLVALLAGAAFMGMRLLNARANQNDNGKMISAGPGGAPGGQVSISIQPSSELPSTKPDFIGQVQSVTGNSIMAQQQSKGIIIQSGSAVKGDGSSSGPVVSSSSDNNSTGITLEVVATKETKIYRDTTMETNPKPNPSSGSGNFVMQQTLELADMTQVQNGYRIQVWGQKRGDRLIADVIVVMGALVIQKGP